MVYKNLNRSFAPGFQDESQLFESQIEVRYENIQVCVMC